MSYDAVPQPVGSGTSSSSSASYPLPAYLNFAPGGVVHEENATAEHTYDLAAYSKTPDATPGNPPTGFRPILHGMQPPDALVHKAKVADDRLRQYALLFGGGDPNTPVFLPSLAVLANAAFGRITGVPPTAAKTWADAMVLQFLEGSEDRAVPRSEEDILGTKPTAMRTVNETTASVLRSVLEESQARQQSVCVDVSSYRPRPCGYVFKRGDIAWNCRTCQTDSTCVICDNCFRNSDHEGHEVYFHRTTPGGCCDCGDAEAWKIEGCCDAHRPRKEAKVETSLDDPEEAVRMAIRGRQEGMDTLTDAPTALPPKLTAALGVVIGAAVNCLVQAVDGAGIGADPIQWKLRWTDELARVCNAAPFNEDYSRRKGAAAATPSSFLDAGTPLAFPQNYRLYLRLHNDDVHTFDEVIEALHDPRSNRRAPGGADDTHPQSLVAEREEANEMTHHVDSDGQVSVKEYSTVAGALHGFRRLKSRGLHCAVVSTAQVDIEKRARVLAAWLSEISSAHPAAAVLVVHALVQVKSNQDIAGVSAWHQPRTIPRWRVGERPDDHQAWRILFNAFPPNLASSYLTSEEAEKLHGMALQANAASFFELTGAAADFYSSVPYRLPAERYRKSPHALWGTLQSTYTDTTPPVSKHPLLYRLITGQFDMQAVMTKNSLTEVVFVVDTDLRKQQEADRITASIFPHRLPGLHMISGIGTVRANSVSATAPPAPNPMEFRHFITTSSFRAPMSPILVLLLLDPYPTKQLRAAIHSLFLSLLTDARFKCRFAAALGVAYRPLSTLFCAGVGTEADTPLGFTVQIFTAGSLVRALGSASAVEKLLLADDDDPPANNSAPLGVFTMPIALNVVRCIHTNLLGATKEVHMILNNTSTGNDDDSADEAKVYANDGLLPALTYVAGEHPLMTSLPAAPDDGFLDSRSTRHKRLPHLLRDLEYVIETPGTAMRLLLPSKFPPYQGMSISSRGEEIMTFSTVWSRLLRLAQGMDPQKRKISGGHVEYEQNRWLEAFGLSLNFAGTRDALAESPTNSSSAALAPVSEDGSHLVSIREAMGNVIAALLKEMKLWLYREGMLETGLPMPPGGAIGASDLSQVEALQRSTLHVSASQLAPSSENSAGSMNNVSTVALSCATTVKMTEAQLDLIESALRMEGNQWQFKSGLHTHNNIPPTPTSGAVMGDWLRVPHSPLAGDSLSFHLPLHRALAKSVRSICAVVVPEVIRSNNSRGWWKLPILDDEGGPSPDVGAGPVQHPLVPLIRPILRSSNCRVVWSAGPDCTAQEAQRRRSRARTVSASIAVAKIIHSIADHPIRCLAAAQQIERHLWARNGSSTAGMALNYSNAPLCRSFRDLDLTLVQLSASGMSVGLGARRVFALLISRFSMDGYLCDPERRALGTASSGGAYATGLGSWVNPPRLQDPDHAVVLSESFFSTLCVIVTELPPPPPMSSSDETWLNQSIRRELVHALAAEPRSHSAAMAAASCAVGRRDESDGSAGTSGGGGLFRDVFAQVLKTVGKQKSQGSRAAAGPASFELDSACCDEYDPSFFHLRRQEHQHAMDVVASLRKQKLSKGKDSGNASDSYCFPVVCAPPKAHPRFLPCRLMLHLSSMDAAVRRALLFALCAGSWLPPPEPMPKPDKSTGSASGSNDSLSGGFSVSSAASGDVPVMTFSRRAFQAGASPTNPFPRRGSSFSEQDPSPPFSAEVVAASSVSFLEVLQLLTLQVHTLEECASLHREQSDLDSEAKMLSAGLSINSYLGRLVRVPDSLKDVWALRPHPDGPLKSQGSGHERGSILGLLIALYEHRADHGARDDTGGGQDQTSDGHGGARALASSGLKWLLRFVNALVDGAPSVSAAVKSATTGAPIKPVSSSNVAGESGMTIWTIDDKVRFTISGMLSNLADLWPKPMDELSEKASKSEKKNKERGKAAQKRMLDLMKKKQSLFVASMPVEAETNKKGNTPDGESELCIICRCDDADGENNGPLGFLGHVQRSRVSQLRCWCEATSEAQDTSDTSSLYQRYRVVGRMGCQVRETEAMDSKPVYCLPKGSIVTVLKSSVSDKYDILSRRVLVKHVSEETGVTTEGWASVQSSQGYVILSPLASLCYENTKWGNTRPIIKMCGHAAHLKCVETHTLSLHQRAAGEQPYDGRFAANIDDGEFLCPLCKQLSNILIPRDGCSRKSESTQAPTQKKSEPATEQGPEESVRSLLTNGATIGNSENEPFSEMGLKALADFGAHLLQAMDVPWERSGTRKRKHRRWHPAIKRWDYEEEDDETGDDISPPNSGSVKSVMRLLRQQHIAWAAIGHSAAAAEACARGVEEVLAFGSFSKTDEPWSGFKYGDDSNPMLLELTRTMTGASGLLDVLVHEMLKQLKEFVGERKQDQISVVGRCLADILGGRDWFVGAEQSLANNSPPRDGVVLWSRLTALMASVPCHVARDSMESQQARAAAAAMWVVRGLGTESKPFGEPPAPLSVSRTFGATTQPSPGIKTNWGTMSPTVEGTSKADAADLQPFRPAVASSFLYTPLLVWDLNSFAGAIFSSILQNKNPELPNGDDLLAAARMLIAARLVQALITPLGFASLENMEIDEEEDEEGRWGPGEMESEGQALAKLFSHCKARVEAGSMDSSVSLMTGKESVSSPVNLFGSIGRSILPYSRSVILMARACACAIRNREKRSGGPTGRLDQKVLESVLDGSESLTTNDGMFILKELGGPLPSDLIDTSRPWWPMLNRWLTGAIGFEKHHGSRGKSLISDTSTGGQENDGLGKPQPGNMTIDGAASTDADQNMSGSPAGLVGGAVYGSGGRAQISLHDMQFDIDGSDENNMEDGLRMADDGAGNGSFFGDNGDAGDDSDDDLIEEMDMDDEAEEMVEFADQAGGNNAFPGQGANDGEDSADEPSSSGSDDGEGNDALDVYARVSQVPIIAYQPSLLGTELIGPGKQGPMFDTVAASAVMADLSHLGVKHRKDVATFSLIRLPKSFVELYGIVNKVKGRDDSGTVLDDNDDAGSAETAICLLTGSVMRSGSSRRPPHRAQRPPGACTLHARKNGSGIGIFFLVQKCTVLLMHNNKSAYSASLYVDEHGEEDPGLRRGRPLFLNDARYRALELLWRQQGIPREVAQIRSTSDRVIRDNWY